MQDTNALFTEDGKLNGHNNVVRLALDMWVDEQHSNLSDDDEWRMLLRAEGLARANRVRMELRAAAMAVYGD